LYLWHINRIFLKFIMGFCICCDIGTYKYKGRRVGTFDLRLFLCLMQCSIPSGMKPTLHVSLTMTSRWMHTAVYTLSSYHALYPHFPPVPSHLSHVQTSRIPRIIITFTPYPPLDSSPRFPPTPTETAALAPQPSAAYSDPFLFPRG